MNEGRLEALSDGVFAVIITIMAPAGAICQGMVGENPHAAARVA